MPEKRELVSYCGLPCFSCSIYAANITPELSELLAKQFGVLPENAACSGCKSPNGNLCHLPAEGCKEMECAQDKGVEFCSDCAEFPCPLLAPTADGAASFPHNTKVYNLARIRNIGLEKWMEEAPEILRKYYTTKFKVGSGQG